MKNKLKLLGYAALTVAGLIGLYSQFHNPTNINDATVMVVRSDGRSGGTGIIVSSENALSKILTNKHVCEVIKNGGLVVTTNGKKHAAVSYKESSVHDLCLITVKANLKANTKLATFPPGMFDEAIVSGHPSLLPNVITKGHFSDGVIIDVMTGFRDCTEEDLKNPDPGVGFFCMLIGKLPVVRRYEAVLVTATIMPGSSGSGVYNSSNELSGVVFAGSGDIGYAFTVPYEYVAYFLEIEQKKLEEKIPNTTLGISELFKQRQTEDEQKLKIKKACLNPETTIQEEACNIINRSLI